MEPHCIFVPLIKPDFLNIKNHKGPAIGPDNGKVNIWSGQGYEWQLKNGITYIQWNPNQWRISYKKYMVTNGNKISSALEGKSRITFPDGAIIHRRFFVKPKIYQYTYEKQDSSKIDQRQNYDIVHPTYWGKKKIVLGPYDITYSKVWDPWIEGLKKKDSIQDYFSFMKNNYGFKQNTIKVVLHKTKRDFWIYSGKNPKTKDDCSGWANKSSFTLCPIKGFILPKSNSKKVQRVIEKTNLYAALLHDSTHNMQHNRCDIVRRNDYSNGKWPSRIKPWYLEGIAELSIIQTQPRYKVQLYKRFYKEFMKSRPSFSKASDPGFRYYRTLGTIFLDFLAQKYGNDAIKKFYDRTCAGISVKKSFQIQFGKDIRQSFQNMYAWFATNKKKFESKYFEWSLQGLHELQSKTQGSEKNCSIIKNDQWLPANMGQVKRFSDIPCIKKAYEFNVQDFKGHQLEFYGKINIDGKTQRVKIFLWKNGAYSIQSKRWDALVSKNEYHFERDDTKVINWVDNKARRIQFKDKSAVYCPGPETKCYFFDKNNKIIKK